jgi:EmrB/QacA subfamily drug resistance transporter
VTNSTASKPMLALALLCGAQFMVILDVTVVNVALPSLQADLGFAFADLQWVVTAYTVAFGGLLLLGGRAADLLGGRRVFLTGLGLFTGASLASGLAASQEMLLAARALQGVGAALLSPAALSLITAIFAEGAARNRALAAWAAVGASGAAFGVLLGGLLTDAFGWEAIFLVNLPLGVAVALASLRALPTTRASAAGRVDVTGALIATGSLVALIYALVEADDEAGWSSGQTLGLLALTALGIAVFAAVEGRVRDPLVPLSVFRRRAAVTALVLMALGMGTLVAGFFFSSLYLQQVLGHSALRTGLEFLPIAAAIVAAAHAAGHLIARLGAKPVIAAGLGISAVGALLLSGLSPRGSYEVDVLPGFLLLAAGAGLAVVGVTITAMAGVGPEEAGLRSGLTSTAHELGIALVLAVLSTVAASAIGGGPLEAARSADPAQLTAGFADAFRVAAGVALAATLVALAALRRADVPAGTSPVFAAH